MITGSFGAADFESKPFYRCCGDKVVRNSSELSMQKNAAARFVGGVFQIRSLSELKFG